MGIEVTPVKPASKAEVAYLQLKEKIIDGTYPPGMVLSIRNISSQLGISRTPVKEAISHLAYEGYVDALADYPAVVSKISYLDMIELLEMREWLEGSAAYYAAIRRTPEDVAELDFYSTQLNNVQFENTALIVSRDNALHMKIVSITQNSRMISTLENLLSSFSRMTLQLSKSFDCFKNSETQHEAVLQAIKAGDPEAARDCMMQHIRGIAKNVNEYQHKNVHLFR